MTKTSSILRVIAETPIPFSAILRVLTLLHMNRLSNTFKSNIVLLMVISSFCLVFKKIINFKKDSFKNCLVEKSKKSDAVSIAESQPTNEPQAQKPVEKMLQSKEAQRRIERYQIFEKFLNEQTHDDNFFSKQIPDSVFRSVEQPKTIRNIQT